MSGTVQLYSKNMLPHTVGRPFRYLSEQLLAIQVRVQLTVSVSPILVAQLACLRSFHATHTQRLVHVWV
jgi:hypothetical protein